MPSFYPSSISMLTDTAVKKSTSLFLFAHQDDEFGVFHQIEKEILAGRQVFCAFATDGGASAPPTRRRHESLRVLRTLGVPFEQVMFPGEELGIPDGHLNRHPEPMEQWLNDFLQAHPMLEALYLPAWEGGHPDHDMLNALGVLAMERRDALELVYQFPLYHGNGCPAPLFKVMSPLPENGIPERQTIPWPKRLRYIRYCLAYPSQWRSWLGLFPFACLHYLLNGGQYLQRVDSTRLQNRPHDAPLYYERRGFLGWSDMENSILELKVAKQAKNSQLGA